MNKTLFHGFETRAAMQHAAARAIELKLRDVLRDGGAAGLVLGGGTTPGPVYETLSSSDLDWGKVIITLSDERCVPPDHDQSNARLISETLLRNAALGARFVPLWSAQETPAMIAEDASVRLTDFPFSRAVQVLGMGGDAHTASLFPDAPEIHAMLAPDAPRVGALHPGSQPLARLSLAARILQAPQWSALLITGEDKKRVLDIAMQPGDAAAMPIRAVLHSGQDIEIFWAP
jgi:6-phosphogluconolactonase